MSIMKRSIMLVLAGVVAIFLSACGGTPTKPETKTPEVATASQQEEKPASAQAEQQSAPEETVPPAETSADAGTTPADTAAPGAQ